ncbi:transmembrane protein 213 isoform X2 [Herpailurus yagouaroundi]|uniref:transmembrane protein 213 isoform X2 n=1 Tax=Herpailurus yagouaroundi TaxID=1608482 RepID=UPI001AD697D5|nr:transmembrane protein 213 isoform X2 [Puma yagouaroundi]
MKHLTPAPRATLALSLVFASFHLVCLAARNSINATLTTHHPDPGTLEQCPSPNSPCGCSCDFSFMKVYFRPRLAAANHGSDFSKSWPPRGARQVLGCGCPWKAHVSLCTGLGA